MFLLYYKPNVGALLFGKHARLSDMVRLIFTRFVIMPGQKKKKQNKRDPRSGHSRYHVMHALQRFKHVQKNLSYRLLQRRNFFFSFE